MEEVLTDFCQWSVVIVKLEAPTKVSKVRDESETKSQVQLPPSPTRQLFIIDLSQTKTEFNFIVLVI